MKCAIIGAGVAGLAAANYLVDRGLQPYLIDATMPGKPKVCGEFFSPEVIDQLEQWGVPLSYKKRVLLHTQQLSYCFEFDRPVASVSRMVLESHLMERAEQNGALFYTNTKVDGLEHGADATYVLKLINNEGIDAKLLADRLIVAAGRFFGNKQNSSAKPCYMGIKAYFTGVEMPNDELYMFSCKQGYGGITISQEAQKGSEALASFCCLADAEAVEAAGGAEKFIEQFIFSFDTLKGILKNAKNRYGWITVPVYSFGQKEVPDWPQAYFCGDAAASIYPASGNGLAMGITSAQMAVEHALTGDFMAYRIAWQARYASRLQYATLLHYLFMHPAIANFGFTVIHFFPKIAQKLYYLTRD